MKELVAIAHDGKRKPEGDFFWIKLRNGWDVAGKCRTAKWLWDENSTHPEDVVEYSASD